MARWSVSLCMVSLILTGAALEAAADKHPFDVHDLVSMQRISDPQPSPDGDPGGLHRDHHGPGSQRGPPRPLARGGRWLRILAVDHRSGQRLQPEVGGRHRSLLPVVALRLDAGVAGPNRRRRGAAGDRPSPRRPVARARTRRRGPLRRPVRLSRLRCVSAVLGGSAGRRGGPHDHRTSVRPAVFPPLGHLVGRPSQPRLQNPVGLGWSHLRRTDRPDGRSRRRLPDPALRRQRGLRDLPRRRMAGVRRQGGGRVRGGLVHRLGSVGGTHRRLAAGALPHRVEPGVGRPTGVLEGREPAGLSGDGAPGLRIGPVPRDGDGLALGNPESPHRELGSLAQRGGLVGRRPRPVRHRGQRRDHHPVQDRSGERHGLRAGRQAHQLEPEPAARRVDPVCPGQSGVTGRAPGRRPRRRHPDQGHPPQRRPPRRHLLRRLPAVLVRGRPRRHGLRLHHEAGGVRPAADLPAGLPGPRRTPGYPSTTTGTTAGTRRSTPATAMPW